jgi:hypothetical protein
MSVIIKANIEKTNITIDVECDSKLSISVIAGAISQIFSNLIFKFNKSWFYARR